MKTRIAPSKRMYISSHEVYVAWCRVGGDAAKARKVAAMQNEVSALEAALTAAQDEYERVKARNLKVCGFTYQVGRL